MLEDDNIRFLMLVHPTWPPCLCHSRHVFVIPDIPLRCAKHFYISVAKLLRHRSKSEATQQMYSVKTSRGLGPHPKDPKGHWDRLGAPSGLLFPEIRIWMLFFPQQFLSNYLRLRTTCPPSPSPSFSESTSKQHRSIHRTCGFKPKCPCSVQLIHFKVDINITYKYEGSEEWDGAEHEGENEAGEQSVTKELDGLEGTGHVGTTKVVEQRIAKHEDTSGSIANKETKKQTNNKMKERNSSLNFFVIQVP